MNPLLFVSGLRFLPILLGCFPYERARCRAIIIHAWNSPSLPPSLRVSVSHPPRISSSRSPLSVSASLLLSPSRVTSYGSYMKYSSQPFIIFVILTFISEMLKGAPVRLITCISPSHCNIYANDAPCEEKKSCTSRFSWGLCCCWSLSP